MGLCGGLLLAVSWSLFLATLPLSLCVCFKVRIIYAALHGFTMVALCVCFKVRMIYAAMHGLTMVVLCVCFNSPNSVSNFVRNSENQIY